MIFQFVIEVNQALYTLKSKDKENKKQHTENKSKVPKQGLKSLYKLKHIEKKK